MSNPAPYTLKGGQESLEDDAIEYEARSETGNVESGDAGIAAPVEQLIIVKKE